MKKVIILAMMIICVFQVCNANLDYVNATSLNEEIYSIYDNYGSLLFQQEGVEVGDMYMGKDFVKYIVTSINENTKTGFAKIHKVMKKPNVDVNKKVRFENVNKEKGSVCLYMTHNDESYLPSDGYDSIYGNGGIYDVAKAFRDNLNYYGITAILDNTLHIPHDTKAYDRSLVTANSMFKSFSPDAMFDIHRDAASRSTYLTSVNGQNKGRVRIVIGMANPYMEQNEEFAMYLISVAETVYPWLFKDIYYGKGHYNQGISSKCLLFEMGCHLIEKEYEIDATKPLAEVINMALYNTTVNEDSGDLTVNGDTSINDTTINDALEDYNNNRLEENIIDNSTNVGSDDLNTITNTNNNVGLGPVLFAVIIMIFTGISVITTLCIYRDYQYNKKNKK